MNIAIETVNLWGDWFASASIAMLLQSSVLIILLASIDWLLRKRARAIVRYSLWMLLLIKLVLPVDLSLPTSVIQLKPSLAYTPPEYTQSTEPEIIQKSEAAIAFQNPTDPIDDSPVIAPESSIGNLANARTPVAVGTTLSPFGWGLLGSISISLALLAAVVWKSFRLGRLVRSCPEASEHLQRLLSVCCEELAVRRRVQLRISAENATPALCGIVRSCILLPHSLATTLSPQELRAVLLHELVHLKRGDLLVNLAQTILQIVYFYHPLLWLANSRIRKLRELAVDEVVLVSMGKDADAYPTALLNVAKFTLNRRGITFGTVGIMESRSAFALRIHRMLTRPFPSSARLGWVCITGMVVISFCVLPMAGREGEVEEVNSQPVSQPSEGKESLSSATSTNSIASRVRSSSMEELFADYEVHAELRKRSQAAIAAEIAARTNALEFLISKLQKNPAKPETTDSIQGRRKAAHLIGKMGKRGEPAVPLLMECLEDDEEVRTAATRSLGEIGPAAKAAVPILQEELHFQNTSAGGALSKIAPQSEEVLNSMLQAVVDPLKDQQFRHQLIFALKQMTLRTPEFTAALDKIAEEPDGLVKEAALQLKGVRVKPRFVVSDPIDIYTTNDIPALIERIRQDPQDYVAVMAVNRLGTNAVAALPALIQLLESKQARFPGNVALAIGTMGPASSNATPVLLRCLDEDDNGLVINSLAALGQIGPAAISAKLRLIEFINDPIPINRWHAANSLRLIDPTELDRCLPILLEPFKEGPIGDYHVRILSQLGDHAKPLIPKVRELLVAEEHTRLAAAETLLTIDPSSTPEVVSTLMQMLEDETIWNRHVAAGLLGKAGQSAEEALPLLKRLARDENPALSTAAQEAVKKIESASNAERSTL